MNKLFKKLNKRFFCDHPRFVAPNLLGKYIVRKLPKGKIIAKIVETEAYGGKEDKACHVGRFGKTKRTEILFGEVGKTYVYPVHINMYCLNIVSHRKNEAGGILLRSLQPILGHELIIENLGYKNKNKISETNLLNGPAKICKALKIDKSFNNIDISKSKDLYITYGEQIKKENIVSTPRINIPYASISKNWKWRFFIKNSKYISSG